MANNNAPYGMRPLAGYGSLANFEMATWRSPYNTAAMYRGDLLKVNSSGNLVPWTAGTAVSQLVGVFDGVEWLSSARGIWSRKNYWNGTDGTSGSDIRIKYVPIQLAATMKWMIQSDSTGVAVTNKGNNCDVVVGTGSTVTSLSGSYLDTTTIATTATLPLRIWDIYGSRGIGNVGPGADNTADPQAYNWAIVIPNVFGTTGI